MAHRREVQRFKTTKASVTHAHGLDRIASLNMSIAKTSVPRSTHLYDFPHFRRVCLCTTCPDYFILPIYLAQPMDAILIF